MLLENNSGNREDYGVLVFNLHFEGSHFRDIMIEPTYCRVEGRKCYRFLISGFLVLIFVASHSLPNGYDKVVLSPDKAVISYDTELSEFKFLREGWEMAAQTTKDVDIQLKP